MCRNSTMIFMFRLGCVMSESAVSMDEFRGEVNKLDYVGSEPKSHKSFHYGDEVQKELLWSKTSLHLGIWNDLLDEIQAVCTAPRALRRCGEREVTIGP
jgi:hypothetical protein